MPNHQYGWQRSSLDQRDYKYTAPRVRRLPRKIDLRPLCPPVDDQGSLGSCTADAICSAHWFGQQKQGAPVFFKPSRLFVYYNERAIEDTIKYDAGAEIRDGFKTLDENGVCPETQWPYAVKKFATKPTPACYTEALKHQAVEYARVEQNFAQMRGCLADGFPFVFGFTVYDSLERPAVDKSGNVPLPKKKEQPLGGHAALAVGYDDSKSRFIFRNSWGTTWGAKGYGTIPYSYLTNDKLSDDFWTLRLVEGGE